MINFSPGVTVMKLREHPLMSYRGVPNWPPAWTWIDGKYQAQALPPGSEVGVLENTRRSAVSPNAMFLTMSYNDSRYVSQLFFDDPEFCQRVCDLLKHHFGSPIQTIGDMEIS
jgi:hypothetical protein